MRRRQEFGNTCVTMKWARLFERGKSARFCVNIMPVIQLANKVVLEAYMFAAFHAARCCESGDSSVFPELNQTFYQRCCSAVSKHSSSGSLFRTAPCAQTDFLQKSVDLWKTRRASHAEKVVTPDVSGFKDLMHNMAHQMDTAARNHLDLNAGKRIIDWLCVFRGLSREAASILLTRLFQSDRASLSPQDLALVDWIGFYPSEENISQHRNHFLRVTWKILRDFEGRLALAQTERCPETSRKLTRGVKMFSLLPQKQGFTLSHIPLNPTTLVEVLGWMRKRGLLSPEHALKWDIQVADLKANRKSANRKGETKPLTESVPEIFAGDDDLPGSALLRPAWKKTRMRRLMLVPADAWWHDLFDLHRCETDSHKFARNISTNGYSASVMLEYPKTDEQKKQPKRHKSQKVRSAKPRKARPLQARQPADIRDSVHVFRSRDWLRSRCQVHLYGDESARGEYAGVPFRIPAPGQDEPTAGLA